ncbi:MAG TPA: hypothetical protein VIP09_04060 [Dehalococcoidia bacterium]
MSTQNEVLTALERAARALGVIQQHCGPVLWGNAARLKGVQIFASQEAHAAFDVSNNADSAAVYKAAEAAITEARIEANQPRREAIMAEWLKGASELPEERMLNEPLQALRVAGRALVGINLLDTRASYGGWSARKRLKAAPIHRAQ